MSAHDVPNGAWGGDPARKQASIEAARVALATGPAVVCYPALRLVPAGVARGWSNVYCAAYGTADPAELELRAGVPAATLMLASATLCACQHLVKTCEGGRLEPLIVGGTNEAPIAVLEAIRVGADPLALARHYVVDLLGQLAEVRDRDGRGLTPERQVLTRQLATLHREGCTDPGAFRAFRRAATVATDIAAGAVETTVLRFVESAAWPLAGLAAELPWMVIDVHLDLRGNLTRERRSPEEKATLEALWRLESAVRQRIEAEPGLDSGAEFAKVEATPEYAAANDPALLARLEGYKLAEVEEYAPFAVNLVIGAFRKA